MAEKAQQQEQEAADPTVIAMWDAETRQEVGPPPSDLFPSERLCFHKVPQPSITAPVIGGCLFVPCCPDSI